MKSNYHVGRRFAIIIGINDYIDRKLDCCVNDANEVKKELINRCKFKEEDIHLITSKFNSPVDVVYSYNQALKKIKAKIHPRTDSILFYFAGHGENILSKSNLLFHNFKYPFEKIHFDISTMNPKFQFYILDSCCSGGRVSFKEKDSTVYTNPSNKNYIENSFGEIFLYACQLNEIANEALDKKHGLLTYYFLESLKNKFLYDEDNILTPLRIQEYVAKKISILSDFNQNPVIESRVTGYYPFAFI